jgi:diguanylate cyclase (GGDEF)-like protein
MRLGRAPEVLRPANLGPQDLAGLIAEMLRLAPAEALRLAEALSHRTHGNPYDTIELVNALRRDGLREPSAHGWSWEAAPIRRYVGHGEVVDLVASRIARLPATTRRLLQTMACLGGNVGLDLLQAATGLSATALEDRLAPALEDGLLVIDCAERSVRFRHDRVQQATYERLARARRQTLHLGVARRLRQRPEHALSAAAQYLSAIAAIRDPREQRLVVALMQAAAAHGRRTANFAVVERFLAGAMVLLAGDTGAADDTVRIAVERELHLALYSLGRLDEADALYLAIERRCSDPMDLAGATAVQVNSLFSRGRPRDAVGLGLGWLGRLGLAVPRDVEAEIPRRLHEFQALIAADAPDDFRRPAASDPRVLAAAELMLQMSVSARFSAPAVLAWLLLECRRLWSEHGPCPALVHNLAATSFVTVGWGDDYRTGYEVARRAVRVGTARGFEPETSGARQAFALFAAPWFEPLEACVEEVRRAREGLLQGGNLHFAGMTFTTTLMVMFDCAATLDEYETEVESALAFAARTGNDHAAALSIQYRQMVRALRGATAQAGSLSDASFDETAHFARVAHHPAVAVILHSLIAIAALIFGDRSRLLHHGAEAMRLAPYVISHYRSALVRWTRACGLAELIRSASPQEQPTLRAELADCRRWMARRAEDAPFNFAHLVHSIDAEMAWAEGEPWRAASAFNAALRTAARHRRPWHLAVIAERAARFHLSDGLDLVGRQLLVESRAAYAAWGASGKVDALDREYPFLRASAGASLTARSVRVSSDAIDLVAVLRASQALSSETSLDRLRARIVELLGTMTGATGVSVVLWRDDPPGWHLVQPGGSLPVEEAGARGLLPIAALRYAERTSEPLLVADAVSDGRFAGDPYLAGLDCCSLLVVPILNHGMPRAVLVLENRLGSDAFSTNGLDTVTLIAGQLAVSFDNALLYASLERKVAERTRAPEQANSQLALLSITDPLTGLANRRRFAETLEAEWARALRSHSALALMLIDVDHFKLFNDRYGHPAGDACLRKVAGALGESVRAGADLVARYGGEEFAVILPGVHGRAALASAERLRARVAALAEPHADAARGIVTVSAGVATVLPSPRWSAEQLIQAADAALYEAKGRGRNQVRLAKIDAGEMRSSSSL